MRTLTGMESPEVPRPASVEAHHADDVGVFPAWPWWLGIVGFVAAFLATFVAGVVLGSIAVVALMVAGIDPGPRFELDESPAILLGGSILQDAIFIGAALAFAWMIARPKAWNFGLRAARFWPAVGWGTLALVLSYAFAFFYSQALGVDVEQTTLDDLGIAKGGLTLVVGAFLIIVLAPVAEEFFFRGFLYRCFRTSLPVLPAALGVGAVFGLVHLPTGADAVPILVVLGVLMCLAYEFSGTLYTVIGVHAVNNAVAFTLGTGEWRIGLGLGLAMLVMCTALPLLFGRGGPARVVSPHGLPSPPPAAV